MLLAWDSAIFRAIHHGLHVPALDPVMMFFTEPGIFRIPLFLVACGLFLSRGARGAMALVVLVMTLTVSDQVSSKVIKPMLKRSRPSVELVDTRPLFGVRRSYAFPSGHATNSAALVPIAATLFPSATVPVAVLAGLVCLSRVYVGDHWPSDVLGGILLGLTLGMLGRKAFLRLERSSLGWGWRRAPGGTPAGGAAAGTGETSSPELVSLAAEDGGGPSASR